MQLLLYNRQFLKFSVFVLVVSCGLPPIPSNGAISGKYFYRKSAYVTCNKGYKLSGTHRMTCTIDGTWNGVPGICTGEVVML